MTRLTAILVGAVLGVIALLSYGAHQRAIGARDAKIAGLASTLKALSRTADSLARAFTRDTVRLTQFRTRWDTLRAELRFTDTLRLSDTVKVEVRVLVTADSTIRACTDALGTCDLRVANAGRRVATLDSLYRLERKRRPSIFARCGLTAGYGAVVAGGAVLAGPGALAGCRVFP